MKRRRRRRHSRPRRDLRTSNHLAENNHAKALRQRADRRLTGSAGITTVGKENCNRFFFIDPGQRRSRANSQTKLERHSHATTFCCRPEVIANAETLKYHRPRYRPRWSGRFSVTYLGLKSIDRPEKNEYIPNDRAIDPTESGPRSYRLVVLRVSIMLRCTEQPPTGVIPKGQGLGAIPSCHELYFAYATRSILWSTRCRACAEDPPSPPLTRPGRPHPDGQVPSARALSDLEVPKTCPVEDA